MDKEIFIKYLKQKVVIRLRNGWKHEGILLYVSEKSVLIDDIFNGETWLDINGILSIQKSENDRNGK